MQAGTSGWWQDMDLWGEDVIIHRRALSSLYRVTDPEQADFFLVPVWVSSAMWQARDCPLEPLSPRTQHEHPSSGELGIQGFARYGRACGGRVHRLHPYDMALFRPARWCRPPLGFRPRSGWLADPRERWDSHPFVCIGRADVPRYVLSSKHRRVHLPLSIWGRLCSARRPQERP